MPVRRTSNHIPSGEMESPIKPGILTILGADCNRNTKAGSIRRTLSADMSSKIWLQQNGFFSPMKKIVSSQQIAVPADEDDLDAKPNQDEVWRSIQAQKELQKPPQQTGVWGGLILTQKSDNSLLQPPYVHPMVKRSKSNLSEKSLEICTESLGSETGSDCFSGHSSDGDDDREEVQRTEKEEVQRTEKEETQRYTVDGPFADMHVVKYKKSPARPLPPPLPSIAGGDGASLHMHSHRENGRLVLEAVSVAPRNFFNAQRQNGRLLLTLNHAPTILKAEEVEEVQFTEAVEDDVEEMVDRGGGYSAAVAERKSCWRKEGYMVEQNLSLPTGMISVHKSMKKLMAVGNINPKWSSDAADDQLPIPQSLPPPAPRLAGASASFNAYEYFWRSKPGFMSTNKKKGNEDLVLYMRGCKEARRSLLREPYCIATS